MSEPEGGRRRSHWRPVGCGCAAIALVVVLFLWFVVLGGGPDGNGLAVRFARRDTCLECLEEVARAVQMYSTDYDEVLPSSALVNHSSRWQKRDFLHFATEAGSLPAGPGSNPTTWPMALYPYLRDKESIWCPVGRDYDTSGRGARLLKPSYYWKTAVDKAWFGEGCSKACRTLSDYRYQRKCIILYEWRPWHFKDRFGFHNLDPKTIGLRNGVKINVAYMDGHAGTVTLQNATSADPLNCAAASDGEPMYFDSNAARRILSSGPASYTDPTECWDSLK